MNTYRPPLREMMFAMKEFGGPNAVLALPGNKELSADLVETILGEAAKFASNVLAPINAQGDRQGCPEKTPLIRFLSWLVPQQRPIRKVRQRTNATLPS